MVDVRGDVLRPPHGTTPAEVKSNKNQKSIILSWFGIPLVLKCATKKKKKKKKKNENR